MMTAEAVTKTIGEVQDEIVEDFEYLEDWRDRYEHIVDVGRRLPPFPDSERTEENEVHGCQSKVWLHAAVQDGKVYYDGDSNTAIVKGLIALALRVYSGRTPDEIIQTPPTYVDRIGMSQHLMSSRAEGLQAVIKRIKSEAQKVK